MSEEISAVPRAAVGLAGAALAIFGILQRDRAFGYPLVGVGGALAIAGFTPAKILRNALPREIEAEHVVTILRPSSELFSFWRSVENCSKWMQLVKAVRETGPRTSQWEVQGPAGVTFTYDAEIIDEVAGEKISWQSTPESPIEVYGTASFKSIGERGTEVRVRIRYGVPVGLAGAIAAFTGHEPTAMLKEDLRRFKQLTECGEIATNEGCGRAKQAPSGEPGTFLKHTMDAVQAVKHTHAATHGGVR